MPPVRVIVEPSDTATPLIQARPPPPPPPPALVWLEPPEPPPGPIATILTESTPAGIVKVVDGGAGGVGV